jgi:hypothetical protein
MEEFNIQGNQTSFLQVLSWNFWKHPCICVHEFAFNIHIMVWKHGHEGHYHYYRAETKVVSTYLWCSPFQSHISLCCLPKNLKIKVDGTIILSVILYLKSNSGKQKYQRQYHSTKVRFPFPTATDQHSVYLSYRGTLSQILNSGHESQCCLFRM